MNYTMDDCGMQFIDSINNFYISYFTKIKKTDDGDKSNWNICSNYRRVCPTLCHPSCLWLVRRRLTDFFCSLWKKRHCYLPMEASPEISDLLLLFCWELNNIAAFFGGWRAEIWNNLWLSCLLIYGKEMQTEENWNHFKCIELKQWICTHTECNSLVYSTIPLFLPSFQFPLLHNSTVLLVRLRRNVSFSEKKVTLLVCLLVSKVPHQCCDNNKFDKLNV